ncbi:MAG TPA: hypothetical protein VE863_12270 [Pyrinomonadaceae bacterium]|jgi:hypothetical protein|nr:hypothetical protein [Pyrinomonadaceae bacterium]
MPPTRKEQIRKRAIEIITSEPSGVRYSVLVNRIHEEFPEIPINTIHGNVWDLDVLFPSKIAKPARGLFVSAEYQEKEATAEPVIIDEEIKEAALGEDQFYEPFADWLKNELEECTKTIALGGNRFRDKWGTPDVLGIREPGRSDIVKSPTEIVSAELKVDKTGLIVAFGQACAYKLFSHRSYIVIPRDSSEEDIARLDVLCRTLGVGLILFDAMKPSAAAIRNTRESSEARTGHVLR